MVSANAVSRAALLGIATGIRSMTPLAALSWAASSGRLSGSTVLTSFLAGAAPSIDPALAGGGRRIRRR